MDNNSHVFGKGIIKARTKIIPQMQKAFKEIATNLLFDAVQLWEGNTSQAEEFEDGSSVKDGVNMTGNTINSYMAGCYFNGRLVDIIYAYDVGVTDKPTAGYSMPGDEIYFWHQVYWEEDSAGEVHTSMNRNKQKVQNYNNENLAFQDVGKGNGITDAKELLQSIQPEGIIGIAIVVGVPYASYLEKERDLDVLTKNAEKSNVQKFADPVLKSVKI